MVWDELRFDAGGHVAVWIRGDHRRGGPLHGRHLLVFQTEEMVLMAPAKSSFLDKVLGRIGRLDPEGFQTVVERLARERSFLETLFNTIEDEIGRASCRERV